MMPLLPLLALLSSTLVPNEQPSGVCDTEGARGAVDRLIQLNSTGGLLTLDGKALLVGELANNERSSWGNMLASDQLSCLAYGGVVARLPAQGERSPDGYLYLRRQPEHGWAIYAVRRLALTGPLEFLWRELEAKAVRSPEEERLYQHLSLVLRSDAALARWLRQHISSLDRLRLLAPSGGGVSRRVNPKGQASPEVERLLEELNLTSAEGGNGLVKIVIGGVLDNSVGFFHSADPDLLPPISPEEFIWIEPLGSGWYLFKTT